VVGGQSLTERPDFGSRQRRHAATLGQSADANIQRAGIAAELRPVIPSYIAIHNELACLVDLPLNRR
jgi:hypothetical protein